MVLLLVVCILLAGYSGAFASGQSQKASAKPSTAAICADIFALRPAGLIGSIFGAVGFVIGLPVTIPTKKIATVGEILVVTPLRFTFERPLGKM